MSGIRCTQCPSRHFSAVLELITRRITCWIAAGGDARRLLSTSDRSEKREPKSTFTLVYATRVNTMHVLAKS